ncbi:MAG: hypothetical protein AB7F28_04015 [Candidatus Margulisiibacteriota bacterium]
MKINIVNYELGNDNPWILGKFSTELEKHLKRLGYETVVTGKPDPQYDVNHHIIYSGYENGGDSIHTLMITHIDYVAKAFSIKEKMRHANLGICMSKETMDRLVGIGIPKEKLYYISPAHNDLIEPKKWVIGLTARLYMNDLKRESFLVRLSAELDPTCFKFVIMGDGWWQVILKLKKRGFEVDYYPEFILETYTTLFKQMDYYLYMGEDEGSMGFVDAVHSGVKTIATAQGFHLDARLGLTHGFQTFEDLSSIFQHLQTELQTRRSAVQHWTWEQYARKHLALWHYLSQTPPLDVPGDDGLQSLISVYENPVSKQDAWRAIIKTDFRLLLANWRTYPLRVLRRLIPRPIVTYLKQRIQNKVNSL